VVREPAKVRAVKWCMIGCVQGGGVPIEVGVGLFSLLLPRTRQDSNKYMSPHPSTEDTDSERDEPHITIEDLHPPTNPTNLPPAHVTASSDSELSEGEIEKIIEGCDVKRGIFAQPYIPPQTRTPTPPRGIRRKSKRTKVSTAELPNENPEPGSHNPTIQDLLTEYPPKPIKRLPPHQCRH